MFTHLLLSAAVSTAGFTAASRTTAQDEQLPAHSRERERERGSQGGKVRGDDATEMAVEEASPMDGTASARGQA